ncbi:MAG: CDP-diacylglycerol--serine O-phosphatidyltransferase [Candidatus Cyclobacteriaceae bacterium M2_1C_046]
MKRHVPNFLTSLNLLSGCIGIVFAFNGDMILSVYLIWLAMLFDFADGLSARLLNVKSAIGKELDSLADMVTFGVLPSILMFLMLQAKFDSLLIPYLAFLIAIFSGIRLAKFNVDTRQEENFIGLPTPANALFISSLIFFQVQLPEWLLVIITLLFSYLLVAELPLFSLKLKSLSWKGNEIRYIFLITAVVLIAILKLAALPFIIVSYVLYSVIDNFLIKRSPNQ